MSIRLKAFTGYAEYEIRDDEDKLFAVLHGRTALDAMRLAACWNACQGVSTENLEDNFPIKELAEKYNEALRERDALAAKVVELETEIAKGLKREIMFSDIVHRHTLAMRAAVVAGHLEGLDHGMQWIFNTLAGPGHLPNLDEARALGGAQAMFDAELREHEAFRAANPVPEPSVGAPAEAEKNKPSTLRD